MDRTFWSAAAPWLRRANALILALGSWVVAAFLLFDAADRWIGGRGADQVMSGVLVFPFSLLALAGALALTVRLVRRWSSMGEEIARVEGAVDKDGAG